MDWTAAAMNLFRPGLQRTLSHAIGGLASLTTLDLSFNPNLTGGLPSEIGNLTKLETINLQACSFTGPIPREIGNLKALQFLALNRNKLTGGIPPSLGSLANLSWFDISENLLQGELPISTQYVVGLDNLTEAGHFHFNNNSLSGKIPKEICSLPKLVHLLLDSNNFSGTIPSEIGNFKSLQILRLGINKFSGSIPSTISNIRALQEIHVRNNLLSGPLPDFSNLTNLTLLDLGLNNFDAQVVPPSIGRLPLITLDVDNINLIGTFPPAILQSSTLESISAMHNHLNGSLNFAQESALGIAEFDYNDITDVFGGSTVIVTLFGNPVCNSTKACNASNSSTNTSVSSPSSSCKVIDCRLRTQNPVNCACQDPYIIEVLLTSPPYAGLNEERMKNLTNVLQKALKLENGQVWVHDSRVTSNSRIIATVYLFSNTTEHLLTDDEFGQITNKIRHHEISLGKFNPYILQTIVTPLRGGGRQSQGIHGTALIGIVVGLIAAIAIILGIGIYALKQRNLAIGAKNLSKQFGSKTSGSSPQLKGARFFTSAELKKATDNFSGSKELGHGGYGKVYLGTLITGEVVAIKKAEAGSIQGLPEFNTEIELLSRVHHKNLVGLVGFCCEEKEQMLVYEYMSNGTLRDRLNGSPPLTWKERLEIAAHSAKGIVYLHEMANPPIIHRDIKSTNILLDDKFVAKVADFGLSKVASEDSHVSTQVKGTMGYIDPEYYISQQLSEKSDVYSFGVVMLEIICAKPPIIEGKYVVREVRNALKEGGINEVAHLLDPRLKNYRIKELDTYIKLALRCANDAAEPRPRMSEVVTQLESLVTEVASYDQGMEIDLSLPVSSHASFDYSGGFQLSTLIEPK